MEARIDARGPVVGAQSFVQQKNITVEGGGKIVRVSPLKAGTPLKDNVIQFRVLPLRKERRFYTVEVLEIDTIQYIMTGVATACWPMNPSWDILRSVRYHSNDGGIFNGVHNMRSHITYTKGDRIRVQVLHMGRTACLVEFAKNDRLVFQQWVHVSGAQLFPTLGFSATTCSLQVDWPLLPAPMVPVALSAMDSWMGFEVIQRGQGSEVVEVVKPITGDSGAVSLVGPRPFDHNFCYFEIELLELNTESAAIGIGVVPPVFSRVSMPGWTKESVGCHSDSGGLFQGNKNVTPDYNNPWQKGDVIGCGVLFSDVTGADDVTERVMVTLFFTRNGSLTHQQPFRLAVGGGFPCVAFQKNKHSVKINTKADHQAYKRAVQGTLSDLNVAQDVAHSDNVAVTGAQPWLRSVEVTSGTRGLVQLTTWPMLVETQSFSVRPIVLPGEKVSESGYNIEVGVTAKMTSSIEEVTWLCSYSLTDRKAPYRVGEGPVTCMVEYTHGANVIFLFHTSERILIRAVFKRPADDEPPACATVCITGACGARMEVNWTRVLFPTAYTDLPNYVLGDWLAGDQTMVSQVPDTIYTRGSATTIQAPTFFSPDFHYMEVVVNKIPNGQLPALGVCAAWSNLQSLIGSKTDELSLDLTTGEVITNNEIVDQLDKRHPSEVTSLGVGALFTQGDVRAPQDTVLYFTLDNRPLFQRVFSSPPGGVYATITFPSNGCEVSVKKDVYPALPLSTCVAWVQNVSANKATQDRRLHTRGTFSTLATRGFAQKTADTRGFAQKTQDTQNSDPHPSEILASNQAPTQVTNKTPTENQAPNPVTSSTPPENQAPPTVVTKRTDPEIVVRRQLRANSKGEVFLREVLQRGEERVVRWQAGEKKIPLEPEPKPSPAEKIEQAKLSTSGVSTAGDKSEDSQTTSAPKNEAPEKMPETESEKPEEESSSSSTTVEKQTAGNTDTPLPKTDTNSDLSTAQTKDNDDVSSKPIPPTDATTHPSTQTSTTGKASSRLDSSKLRRDLDDLEGLRFHQSMNVGRNTDLIMRQVKHNDSTIPETAALESGTSESPSSQHTEAETAESQTDKLPAQDTKDTIESQPLNQPEKEIRDLSNLDSQPSQSSFSTTQASQSSSSSSSSLAGGQASGVSGAKIAREEEGEGAGGEEGDRGGNEWNVRDSVATPHITNLLMDPSVVWEEQRMRNADLIETLSERQAKAVLSAINETMAPIKMMAYLSEHSPGTKGNAKHATPMTTQSTSPVTSSPQLRRLNRNSKACSLS